MTTTIKNLTRQLDIAGLEHIVDKASSSIRVPDVGVVFYYCGDAVTCVMMQTDDSIVELNCPSRCHFSVSNECALVGIEVSIIDEDGEHLSGFSRIVEA